MSASNNRYLLYSPQSMEAPCFERQTPPLPRSFGISLCALKRMFCWRTNESASIRSRLLANGLPSFRVRVTPPGQTQVRCLILHVSWGRQTCEAKRAKSRFLADTIHEFDSSSTPAPNGTYALRTNEPAEAFSTTLHVEKQSLRGLQPVTVPLNHLSIIPKLWYMYIKLWEESGVRGPAVE